MVIVLQVAGTLHTAEKTSSCTSAKKSNDHYLKSNMEQRPGKKYGNTLQATIAWPLCQFAQASKYSIQNLPSLRD